MRLITQFLISWSMSVLNFKSSILRFNKGTVLYFTTSYITWNIVTIKVWTSCTYIFANLLNRILNLVLYVLLCPKSQYNILENWILVLMIFYWLNIKFAFCCEKYSDSFSSLNTTLDSIGKKGPTRNLYVIYSHWDRGILIFQNLYLLGYYKLRCQVFFFNPLLPGLQFYIPWTRFWLVASP